METITFEKESYNLREIQIPEFGAVMISTLSLNKRLLDDEGAYVNNTAIEIDEQIFYFVEESEIDLPEQQLVNLIVKQTK